MQYHQDGFRPGAPDVAPPAAKRTETDVLIVGCGPAGLTLAAQLCAFPEISTRIVERKAGPLEMGQADGIACRSMEMFQAFGFAERVAREGYQVNETVFWRPNADGRIARAHRIEDVEPGISEMPHMILSQARVHDFYLDHMRQSAHRLEPDYGLAVQRLSREGAAVHVTLRNEATGETAETRARYVIGCDGARSTVRAEMGLALKGSSARQLWGVMDVLAETDFPDIRFKCAIQSFGSGSMIVIPREGGHMVRLYIELGALQDGERAADRGVTAEMLTDRARAILAPHRFDVRQVPWFSAYEIGQRLAPAFDDARPDQGPRIFIAGDACHTHSPKAGQGMNVSMADAFNLGWKLAAVLRGQAPPDLLRTYGAERHAMAEELIAFHKAFAEVLSRRPQTPEEAAEYQRLFQRSGRYTAGVEARYGPSRVVALDQSRQDLAEGVPVGKRFHSAPVIRVADAKPMQLGHALRADGRWRLILFAPEGDLGHPNGPVAELCGWLGAEGPVARVTPKGADADAVIDLRAVFQARHDLLSVPEMPALLRPETGALRLTDHEKVFTPDTKQGPDIFDLRAIDRARGAVVVVRPDQFVAAVLGFEDRAALGDVMDGVLLSAPEDPTCDQTGARLEATAAPQDG